MSNPHAAGNESATESHSVAGHAGHAGLNTGASVITENALHANPVTGYPGHHFGTSVGAGAAGIIFETIATEAAERAGMPPGYAHATGLGAGALATGVVTVLTTESISAGALAGGIAIATPAAIALGSTVMFSPAENEYEGPHAGHEDFAARACMPPNDMTDAHGHPASHTSFSTQQPTSHDNQVAGDAVQSTPEVLYTPATATPSVDAGGHSSSAAAADSSSAPAADSDDAAACYGPGHDAG
jgi:hypothetical protein